MEGKKNVLIFVLVVLVLVLGGYLFYDKVILKEDNNPVEENVSKDNENTDKEKEYINEEIYTSDSYFKIIDNKKLVEDLDEEDKDVIELANEYLLNNQLDELFYYLGNKSVSINELDNKTKLEIMYWLVKDDKNGKYITDYSSEELLEILQNYFGNSFTIEFEDIIFEGDSEATYTYNQATKKYEATGYGHGASFYAPAKMHLVDYEKKDNQYYVTYTGAYYISIGDDCSSEVDLYNVNKEKIGTTSLDCDTYKLDLSIDKFLQIEDKTEKLTFIFEKEGTNLVLVGYQVEE